MMETINEENYRRKKQDEGQGLLCGQKPKEASPRDYGWFRNRLIPFLIIKDFKLHISELVSRDLEVQVKSSHPCLCRSSLDSVWGLGLEPQHGLNLLSARAQGITACPAIGAGMRFVSWAVHCSSDQGPQTPSGSGDQEVAAPPSSVSYVPSDREQAALEKTNIYSSNGSWHRLFPEAGVWLSRGWTQQEVLREIG
jgi:hypothetical protein